jgi:hypothetical protein
MALVDRPAAQDEIADLLLNTAKEAKSKKYHDFIPVFPGDGSKWYDVTSEAPR